MKKEPAKIEDTINLWFNRTYDLLDSEKDKKTRAIDGVVFASVQIVDNYIQSAINILNEGKKLPAKALIRITSELIAKVIWCIEGKNSEEVNKRIKQWDKQSLMQEKRLISKFKNSEKENMKKFYDQRIAHINSLSPQVEGVKKMPSVAAMLEDELYANVYVQFNGAIHIDTFVLSESINDNRTLIEYTGDTKEDVELLKGCCLSNVYIFFCNIYAFFGWDYTEITKEHAEIAKES